MYNNIIFIGGIHGVGKGTLCSEIAHKINFRHISASEVLKWSEVSPDPTNKLVKDIPDTQQRLIKGLKGIIETDQRYILDGHFCLFDSNGSVKPIPEEIFMNISPILLSVVICDARIVADRLHARDNKKYDTLIIEKMQKIEIEHAQLVADKLNVDLIEVESNPEELIDKINSL
ncbi:ATP-binding protein [Roseivirga pacifica]|uniref:ATP-binding protein n=1 Tax=Roseivirga pacifica TaxID=1267423 RepID=UPI002095CA3C|nr:ATP-binding protein [Roseivirga pacifica]MCO6360340.1 AAA family ATPase [Roseivirga pacifica]MCO6368229.1 AAA family ATPase [Roseivirga pacifica]MCO6372371.1 AAA family ATPase [Roseivirga pacifica]MCO6376429.1 AAA family ATPase [Roseivirga pacifica]MCO6378291.1 AAA family ATPase [Roseivirga pacifica]